MWYISNILTIINFKRKIVSLVSLYNRFELTHTKVCPNTHIRVMGNTLIRVFLITHIRVLKAVSNKQKKTTLHK